MARCFCLSPGREYLLVICLEVSWPGVSLCPQVGNIFLLSVWRSLGQVFLSVPRYGISSCHLSGDLLARCFCLSPGRVYLLLICLEVFARCFSLSPGTVYLLLICLEVTWPDVPLCSRAGNIFLVSVWRSLGQVFLSVPRSDLSSYLPIGLLARCFSLSPGRVCLLVICLEVSSPDVSLCSQVGSIFLLSVWRYLHQVFLSVPR